MSSNDTCISVRSEESLVMSNPLLEYLEDERRGFAGEDGLTETAQMKDSLALECFFDGRGR